MNIQQITFSCSELMVAIEKQPKAKSQCRKHWPEIEQKASIFINSIHILSKETKKRKEQEEIYYSFKKYIVCPILQSEIKQKEHPTMKNSRKKKKFRKINKITSGFSIKKNSINEKWKQSLVNHILVDQWTYRERQNKRDL